MAGPAAAIGSFFVSGSASAASGIFDPPARDISYASNALLPNRLPSIEQIFLAYRNGFMDRDTADKTLKANGVMVPWAQNVPVGFNTGESGVAAAALCRKTWAAMYAATETQLQPGELDDLFFRGYIPDAEWQARMGVLGYSPQIIQQYLAPTRWPLPPSDLAIRAELRALRDADVVSQLGLDEGLTDKLRYWLNSQGLNWSSDPPGDITDPSQIVTWATIAYRDHWRWLDTATATNLFFRLRPSRIDKWQAIVPDIQPFTQEMLTRVYTQQDIAPGFQPYLQASYYKTLSVRQLQQGYALGVMTDSEVTDQLMDQGWTPADAALRTQVIVAQTNKQYNAKLNVNPKPAILKAYEMRLLTRDQAGTKLWQWLIWDTPAGEQFAGLPANKQAATARAQPSVNAILDQVDLEGQIAWTNRAIKRWRRRYLHGMADAAATRTALVNMGIDILRAGQIVAEWTDEMSSGKLLASTGQIRAWTIKQIIPIATAEKWLSNLGWQAPEINAIMLEIMHDFSLEQARAMEKIAKTQAQIQAAQARQISAANRAANQARQKLLATLSPAKAHRYFVRGILRLQDLSQILQQHDYQGVALNAALADAQIDRAEWIKKQQPKPPKQQPAGAAGAGS